MIMALIILKIVYLLQLTLKKAFRSYTWSCKKESTGRVSVVCVLNITLLDIILFLLFDAFTIQGCVPI